MFYQDTKRKHIRFNILHDSEKSFQIDIKIFTGCNIENVSFSLTIYSERVALFNAISEGYQKFDAIAIVSNINKTIFACGACR